MKGILSAVRQLEPLGAEVLKKWASDLLNHVTSSEFAISMCLVNVAVAETCLTAAVHSYFPGAGLAKDCG